jgi:hypothetical protein
VVELLHPSVEVATVWVVLQDVIFADEGEVSAGAVMAAPAEDDLAAPCRAGEDPLTEFSSKLQLNLYLRLNFFFLRGILNFIKQYGKVLDHVVQ